MTRPGAPARAAAPHRSRAPEGRQGHRKECPISRRIRHLTAPLKIGREPYVKRRLRITRKARTARAPSSGPFTHTEPRGESLPGGGAQAPFTESRLLEADNERIAALTKGFKPLLARWDEISKQQNALWDAQVRADARVAAAAADDNCAAPA